MASPKIVSSPALTTLWKRQLDQSIAYSDSTVVSVLTTDAFSYFGSCGTVFQLDNAGNQSRQINLSASEIRMTLSADSSQLFVGTGGIINSRVPDNILAGYWINYLKGGGDGVVNSMADPGDLTTLYVGAGGVLYALNVSPGAFGVILRTNNLPGMGSSEVNLALSSDGSLLYAAAGGQVAAIEKSTFAQKAINYLPGGGQGTVHVISTSSAVYVGANGIVWALDPKDISSELASNSLISEFGQGEVRMALSPDFSKLYVGLNGNAIQLDSATLDMHGTNTLPDGGTGVVNLIATANDVYAGAGGMVYKLAADGLNKEAVNNLPGLGHNEVRLAMGDYLNVGIMQTIVEPGRGQNHILYVGNALGLEP